MIAQVVRADVMRDASGRSKGCGIVEYRTAVEAQTAINTLLDTELKGRLIFVREDREAAGPSVPIPVRLAYKSTGFVPFFLAAVDSSSSYLLPWNNTTSFFAYVRQLLRVSCSLNSFET